MPNSASGTRQHDDAATAPSTPPPARSLWPRSRFRELASDSASRVWSSTWLVMSAFLHPVAATGSRANFHALRYSLKWRRDLDWRTVPAQRGQYRDHPLLRTHQHDAEAVAQRQRASGLWSDGKPHPGLHPAGARTRI